MRNGDKVTWFQALKSVEIGIRAQIVYGTSNSGGKSAALEDIEQVVRGKENYFWFKTEV